MIRVLKNRLCWSGEFLKRKTSKMAGITSWREALADPCFWTAHYGLHLSTIVDDLDAFYGPAGELCKTWDTVLFGDQDMDTPLLPEENFVYLRANILTLALPEQYSWALEYGAEGLDHMIYHPQVYPEGIFIAHQGGNAELPGLRWTELKQIVACLEPTWPGDFALHTLYPLLYPLVDPIEAAEYDEVRQTLRAAWEALELAEPFQLEQWLDASIQVYEKGRLMRYDAAQGWQEIATLPAAGLLGTEQVWLCDPARGGWFTAPWRPCPRRDARRFVPFFAMLERHAPASLK